MTILIALAFAFSITSLCLNIKNYRRANNNLSKNKIAAFEEAISNFDKHFIETQEELDRLLHK